VSGLRNDYNTLARTARDHLSRARMLGTSLDKRAKHEARNGGGLELWQPDDSWRADFDKVSTAIVQAGNALQKALEANQKKLGGMTVEQLEAQLIAELPRLAQTFTPAQWESLDRVRMKQVLSR
jgi:hypothetical protein